MSLTLGRFFEDFSVGDRLQTMARTVTETDVINYLGVSLIIEELMLDVEYVTKKSAFGRRVAPGSLIFAFAEGLITQTGFIRGTAVAFLGMDNYRVAAPTAVGDTIHVEMEIVETRKTSKPGRGIIKDHNKVVNQLGQVVVEFTAVRMIKCRSEE